MKKIILGLFMFGFLFVGSQVRVASAESMDCSSSTAPFIKIATPNGGEVLQAGKEITVGWSSCNIPSGETVLIEMIRADVINDPIVGNGLPGWILLADSVPNNGYQVLTLNKTIAPGTYELAVKGDTADDISDNIFTITANDNSLPDLVVTDFNWTPQNPTTSTALGSLAMSVTIKNIGDASVVLPENSRVSVVMNETSYGGFGLGTAYYKLNPGDSQSFDFHTTQDPNILAEPGTFDLIVTVDDNIYSRYSGGLVKESNENNNSLTKKITISGNSIYATPSMTILAPNGGVDYRYRAGDSIDVEWKTLGMSRSAKLGIIRLRGYSSNNGGEYDLTSNNTVLNDGKESVLLPANLPIGNYKLEIKSYVGDISVFDESDNVFEIISPATTTDTSCSAGAIYSYTTGQRCSTINVPICPANMPNPGSLCSDGKIEAATKDSNNCTTSYRCIIPQNDLGCKNHEIYSTVTKQLCPIVTTDSGCTSTSKYSSTTGQACLGKVPEVDGGCNGINKYSLMTGKICSNFTGVYTPVIPNTIDIPITRTLKLGTKGDDVKALQAFLNLLADGSFGPKTQAKVIEWQAAHGLTADGSFGPKSRQKAGLNQ